MRVEEWRPIDYLYGIWLNGKCLGCIKVSPALIRLIFSILIDVLAPPCVLEHVRPSFSLPFRPAQNECRTDQTVKIVLFRLS